MLLGAGGVFGALVGSYLSINYLGDLDIFKPVFGVFVLLIALQLAWNLLRPGKRGTSASGRAATAFENLISSGGEASTVGIRYRQHLFHRIEFEFAGEQFGFSPWLQFVTGAGIAVH